MHGNGKRLVLQAAAHPRRHCTFTGKYAAGVPLLAGMPRMGRLAHTGVPTMATAHKPATAANWPQAAHTALTALGALVVRAVASGRPSTRYALCAGLGWAMANGQPAKAGHAQAAKWWAAAMLAHYTTCNGQCFTGPAYSALQGYTAGTKPTVAQLVAVYGTLVPAAHSNLQGMLGTYSATQQARGLATTYFAAISPTQPNVAAYNAASGHTAISTGFAGAPAPQPA